MQRGLVIADAGPIFSLAVLDKLSLLEILFERICIPNAVWEEITRDQSTPIYEQISAFFAAKTVAIAGKNNLTFVLDYGESEAVILYQELAADLLLIDDRKARIYAESLEINCIGTLGLLVNAKATGHLETLRPLFQQLLDNNRYYSVKLLNSILSSVQEPKI